MKQVYPIYDIFGEILPSPGMCARDISTAEISKRNIYHSKHSKELNKRLEWKEKEEKRVTLKLSSLECNLFQERHFPLDRCTHCTLYTLGTSDGEIICVCLWRLCMLVDCARDWRKTERWMMGKS